MKPINTLSSRFKCILARAICALAITGICTNANGQLPDREAVKEKLSNLQASSPNYQTDTLYIELLLELGFQMRYFKADSLYVLADKALEYSQKTNYAKGECQALIRLGDYYSDKGEYNRAIDYYKKALQLAREIDNTGHLLRTLNNLAGEYAYIGDYAKALSGFLEGIALAEEADHKEMLSIMNENIANLYASQKDYDHSLEFFKKVIKINIEVGNEIDIAETLSNLASLYADMGNMDYAMFNINKGIAIFEKRKIDDWLAFAYEIKGKIYLNQKNYKWALYWYKQSEMIHKKIDDERGKIDLYNGMAEAYLGMKMDSLSQHFAIQAFEISDRIRFMEGMQKCAKTLFTINKNKRNYKVAL
jgi:tetratricopeptide (TPR) repeat protein